MPHSNRAAAGNLTKQYAKRVYRYSKVKPDRSAARARGDRTLSHWFDTSAFANAFNHPNFNDPGNQLINPRTFGVTTGAQAPRVAEFTLRIFF